MKADIGGDRLAGFTLVEVLVTLIVVAIGILGLAGLQLANMRSNYSAYLRTQATIAAYDLIDRMRVDPGAFRGKHYDTSGGDSGNALFDDWRHQLSLLALRAPAEGAQGEVNCDNGNGCATGNCEVVLRWDDSRAEDAAWSQSGRNSSAVTFRVCTRLAQ